MPGYDCVNAGASMHSPDNQSSSGFPYLPSSVHVACLPRASGGRSRSCGRPLFWGLRQDRPSPRGSRWGSAEIGRGPGTKTQPNRRGRPIHRSAYICTYVRTYVKRTGTRTAAAERLETVKRFGTEMSLWGWLGWVRSIRVVKLLRSGASDDGFHRHELTGLHPAGAPSSMPSRRQNKFEYCRTIGRSTDRKVERQKG